MDSDREYRGGKVPLPYAGSPEPADPGDRRAPSRRDGIRNVRRVSNWTAAALIVGAGSATVALAHQSLPTAGPASGAAPATSAAGTSAARPAATGPTAAHSVATTSASGVTVTTTTRTVHGKTVVTHVRHAPVYHDS